MPIDPPSPHRSARAHSDALLPAGRAGRRDPVRDRAAAVRIASTAGVAARRGRPIGGAGAVEGGASVMAGAVRVVVGLDGSPESLAALERAVREAGRREAVLVAVSTWVGPARRPRSGAERSARRRVDESFARVTGGYPAGLVIRPAVVRGGLGAALVAAAAPGDLIVVGEGGSRLARLLHASPAALCRARARCPVLAVRLPRRMSGPVPARAAAA
ncbi:universal stress protein [Streptomyces sp. NRRL B-24484]|uniref:universal stress protein n=1 Tax=Streptomyces sp. NRRL B-24484 TaxID=1463833 RepID=UPI000D12EBBB|nr:universal stress protein [Streptomyces sp. NRRL B-24484]